MQQELVFKCKNRYVVYSINKKNSTKIAFIFSGVDATAATCRMSYFGLNEELDCTVVHIADNFGAHGSYLLSVAGDEQIRNVVLLLMRSLIEEGDIQKENVYLLGTSKGATTAVMYGLMLGYGHVICGEPQIRLGDFIYNKDFDRLEQWRSLAYAIMGRVNFEDKQRMNEICERIVFQYGERYQGKMDIHVGNTGYFEGHIAPLIEMAGSLLITRLNVFRHDFVAHSEVVPVFYSSVRSELIGD